MSEPLHELPDDLPEVVAEVIPDPPPNPVPEPRLLDPSRIDPMTEQNQPDKGTKLFVLFFFLIVPPLGVVILLAICWSMWKAFNA